MTRKVVLAYSGGLDTSIILKWLVEDKGFDVVAYVADLGQGDELDEVVKKAEKTGASETIVVDEREEFVKDFIFPALRMNAIYENLYLLGTSLARPCIARNQVEIARKTGANVVSHGATGKGNDQVRFELTYYALKPDIEVVAPWREWSMKGRSDLVAYAEKHGIPIPVTKERPYSSDRNIFHISFETGILEDPDAEPPEDLYVLTKSPQEAPDEPRYIEVSFEAGNPVAVDGERLGPVELLERLNEIGGENGVGRDDIVENRYVGIKCRAVYETPGGTILHRAHRAVETLTLDREALHLRDSLIPKYAELVYNGYWYSPEREMIQAACDLVERDVTGTARLKLYKGNCFVVGRRSERTLYRPDLATFEAESVYDQADATGFIKINALRLRTLAMRGE